MRYRFTDHTGNTVLWSWGTAAANSFTFNDNVTGVATASVMPATTYTGWFLGTGYEYGLDFFVPGLFWKTEYRYSSFDWKNNSITASAIGPYTERARKDIQTIRSELVWRFSLF